MTFILLLLIFYVCFYLINRKKRHRLDVNIKKPERRYFYSYIIIWSLVASICSAAFFYWLANLSFNSFFLSDTLGSLSGLELSIFDNNFKQVIADLKSGIAVEDINVIGNIDKEVIVSLAIKYIFYKQVSTFSLLIFSVIIFSTVLLYLFNSYSSTQRYYRKVEKIIEYVMFLFALIAVITTIGIISALFFEAIKFFAEVSVFDFIFGIQWSPENYSYDIKQSFGFIPLLTGTLLISFISVTIAIIIGVFSAIYMSEYMNPKIKNIVKPSLEILAGIPSIIYGFFAAIFFAPFLIKFFNLFFDLTIPSETALNAGIIMGIMIVPSISSISDDVISSIPKHIREGGYAIGSMQNEVIRKIILPAAMPGIMGGILLAVSRAIGETMIVVMASSLAANLTFNPLEPVTTITTQIVMLVQGDQEFNSPKTLAAFALGFMLLIVTLALNIIAIKIMNKYKGLYD